MTCVAGLCYPACAARRLRQAEQDKLAHAAQAQERAQERYHVAQAKVSGSACVGDEEQAQAKVSGSACGGG